MQLEKRDMPDFMQEYWDILTQNADTVIQDCVQKQGIGGWIEAGKSVQPRAISCD